jgi:dTDP-4-dehydrorhamnose 3,5-epimerase
VEYRELTVPGAWEITPKQFGDPRGVFLEWFKGGPFGESVGHRLDLAQANLSVSAAGVVRGIHFADVPPGQAKYVTCPRGAVLDVVVDIRVGSPTFGQWDSVLLDDVDRRAIYLGEGLGHAFMSLEDDSTVLYLCSTPYSPGREHGIHPLDPEVGIAWPTVARDGTPLTPQLSEKDTAAPGLAQARQDGLLPTLDAVAEHLASLRA